MDLPEEYQQEMVNLVWIRYHWFTFNYPKKYECNGEFKLSKSELTMEGDLYNRLVILIRVIQFSGIIKYQIEKCWETWWEIIIEKLKNQTAFGDVFSNDIQLP